MKRLSHHFPFQLVIKTLQMVLFFLGLLSFPDDKEMESSFD